MATHRTSLRKHNPFGTGRKWWAKCSCGWYQGCQLKQDAQRLTADHLAREAIA